MKTELLFYMDVMLMNKQILSLLVDINEDLQSAARLFAEIVELFENDDEEDEEYEDDCN